MSLSEGQTERWGAVAAAFDPGRRGLRVLAVVAVVVGIAAAAVAWWSRPDPEPILPQLTASEPVVSASVPAELVVAVSGLVHRPGLVRLPPGARVADAVEAAGGALPDAELDQLNLARRVVDGELITVGVPPPPNDPAGPPGGGPLNLNTATAAQLETLPGVGPTLAKRIIAYRTAHGPFTSVAQLREVPGIGETRFAELEALVTV